MSYRPATGAGPTAATAAPDAPIAPEVVEREPTAEISTADGIFYGSTQWFDALATVGVCSVLSFGSVALLLALIGEYSIAPVMFLGTLGTLLLYALARPRRAESAVPATRRSTVPAAAMVMVAAVV